MPRVGMGWLLRSIRRERNPAARDRLLACRHRKRGRSIRRICRMMVRPYSTVRDWLWRMQERGLRGRYDRKRGRRKCRMSKPAFESVRRWLKRKTEEFGFESGSWQLNLAHDVIRRELGIDCKTRTLRRWLRRIGFSWKKNSTARRRGRPNGGDPCVSFLPCMQPTRINQLPAAPASATKTLTVMPRCSALPRSSPSTIRAAS